MERKNRRLALHGPDLPNHADHLKILPQPSIHGIPFEALARICLYLGSKDIENIGATSRYFRCYAPALMQYKEAARPTLDGLGHQSLRRILDLSGDRSELLRALKNVNRFFRSFFFAVHRTGRTHASRYNPYYSRTRSPHRSIRRLPYNVKLEVLRWMDAPSIFRMRQFGMIFHGTFDRPLERGPHNRLRSTLETLPYHALERIIFFADFESTESSRLAGTSRLLHNLVLQVKLERFPQHWRHALSSDIASNDAASTTFPLEKLPSELVAIACSFLSRSSLVSLMSASRSLRMFIEPMIWTRIELHSPGYHEHQMHEDERAHERVLRQHHGRDYILDREDKSNSEYNIGSDARYWIKTFKFFELFNNRRLMLRDALARHIRHLCLTWTIGKGRLHVNPALFTHWKVLSCFQELEHLELTCQMMVADLDDDDDDETERDNRVYDEYWLEIEPIVASKMETSNATHLKLRPLKKLRAVHLIGYVPPMLVRWILDGSAEKIQDLKLFILDDLPEWDARLEELTGPAPIGKSTLLGTDIISRLLSVSRLTLCRPVECVFKQIGPFAFTRPGSERLYNLSLPPDADKYKADSLVLGEAAALLRATRNTLEDLVLDQRTSAAAIAGGWSKAWLETATYMVVSLHAFGYQRFCDLALPALLEKPEDGWPRLKSIQLHGFDLPAGYVDLYRKYGWNVRPLLQSPPMQLFDILRERFEPSGVDVASGIGKTCFYDPDFGHVDLRRNAVSLAATERTLKLKREAIKRTALLSGTLTANEDASDVTFPGWFVDDYSEMIWVQGPPW